MSILTSRITQTIVLDPASEQTVTIRKLSGRHLEQAALAKQASSRAFVAQMGGAAFREELAKLGDVAPSLVQQAQADPLNRYDRTTVLLKGIVAISELPEFGTLTVEAKTALFDDELSQEDAARIVRAILDLTLPARDEAEKKTA